MWFFAGSAPVSKPPHAVVRRILLLLGVLYHSIAFVPNFPFFFARSPRRRFIAIRFFLPSPKSRVFITNRLKFFGSSDFRKKKNCYQNYCQIGSRECVIPCVHLRSFVCALSKGITDFVVHECFLRKYQPLIVENIRIVSFFWSHYLFILGDCYKCSHEYHNPTLAILQTSDFYYYHFRPAKWTANSTRYIQILPL